MPAISAFRTSRRVEFSDTDMAGIVHFANFFRFMEAAEHAYLRACGLGVFLDWQGERVTFPRVSASCDYRVPARFDEVLDITVRIDRLGRSSVRFAITFHRGEHLIAEGQITTVLCRVVRDHGLEPIAIPQPWREALERGAERPSG
jgi:YbgC/YbaW family acyl-CoA thioester hydrolase